MRVPRDFRIAYRRAETRSRDRQLVEEPRCIRAPAPLRPQPRCKTLARWPGSSEHPPGFGVVRRQSAAATALWIFAERPGNRRTKARRSAETKAAWRFASRRTTRRYRDHHAPPNFRQVLECAAPAAL